MNLAEKYQTEFEKYGVNTSLRKAHFMAQIEHESGLKPIDESFNYKPERLHLIFKKYFPTIALANAYAGNKIKIANRVYANRMGNGNEASGEGYKYHGRGFIQLTGKDNYKAFAKATGIDVVTYPDLLLDEQYAIIAALHFWKSNGLNALADKDDLDAVSDKINIGHVTEKEGDAIGYAHRKELLTKYKKIFLNGN
jgi:putative chitinase